MEDELKILKVEYLSYQLLNHTQISKLSLDYQTIFKQVLIMKMTSNLRRTQNIKSGISQQQHIGS